MERDSMNRPPNANPISVWARLWWAVALILAGGLVALLTLLVVGADCGEVGDPCRNAALLHFEQVLALVALVPLLFLVIAIFTGPRRRVAAGLIAVVAFYVVWGVIWAIAFH
jgi:hypothetical protein